MPEWAGEKKKGEKNGFLLEDVKLEDFNPAGGEGAPALGYFSLGVFFLLVLGKFNGNLTGF